MRDELATALNKGSFKLLLLGSGELGREVAIEAMRLGIETVAVDRYENAPAQQVAHRAYSGNMKDAGFLRGVIEKEKPNAIVPEIEAINLDVLFDLEKEGYFVVPNAKAAHTAMHRKRIRELVAKEAKVPCSKYVYAPTNDIKAVEAACDKIGYPCITKAIMSSSGEGSFFVKSKKDIPKALEAAKRGRGSSEEVIIEEVIDFDVEITELAIRHYDGEKVVTSFPDPIGQFQIEGDYHSSWQPADISDKAEKKIYEYSKKVTDTLGGVGIFGCELFVKGDTVWFNEVSPRPHDTGLVTIATHPTGFSEGGLHVRAITGLPIPVEVVNGIRRFRRASDGASHVIKSPSEGSNPRYRGLTSALSIPGVTMQLFGKPIAHVGRRMGLAFATDKDVYQARLKAEKAAHLIEIATDDSAWAGQNFITKKHLEAK